METFFYIAGCSVAIHLVGSVLLLALVRNDPLAQELFALPNSWLGPRPRWLSLQLLRAKFFLPWIPAPSGMAQQTVSVRLSFWTARFAGAVFPCAILAFLVLAFIGSTG